MEIGRKTDSWSDSSARLERSENKQRGEILKTISLLGVLFLVTLFTVEFMQIIKSLISS